VTVPGREGQYLILPFGLHWSEARASDMMVFDEAGGTLEGEGVVELSARCIHAPIHRITARKVVLHTHQTWALALNMLRTTGCSRDADGGLLSRAHRLRRRLQRHGGHAARGRAAARLMATSHRLHEEPRRLVTGQTIAQAYKRLYKLERVCRTQVLALGTGKPLEVPPDEYRRPRAGAGTAGNALRSRSVSAFSSRR
jgi:ribulose-5-phosphate 4-epimerase/fuculose-1-phosphate aldolase